MEVGKLTIPVNADLGPLNTDLNRLRQQLGGAERQTQGVTRAMNGMERQTRGLTALLRPLSVALAGIFSFRAITQMTDAWSTMGWQLQNAVGSAEKAAAVMERLNQVARSTWSPIQTVTDSFIRQNAVMSALGYSTEQQVLHTEALNAAILVSGLRGARAESVAAAWTRAMAAGALRGQEFNTIAENSSRLMQALADKLGVTVPELRKLAAEGKITSDVMFGITDSVEELRRQLEGDATFSGSIVLMGNALMRVVGELDKAAGASSSLGSALVWVADNMERVLAYAVTGAAGWATYRAAVLAVNAGLFTMNGLLALVRRALITSGIGIAVIAAGELVYQLVRLTSATGGFGNALNLLGGVASGVWDGIKISAQALAPALNAVWLEIQAGFITMIRNISDIWNEFLAEFEAPALTVTIGGQTHELIGGFDLSGWKLNAGELNGIINGMRDSASDLRDEASALASEGFDVAREALAALNVEVENAEANLSDDGGSSFRNLSEETSDAAKEAKKLADAYRDIVAGAREYIDTQNIEAQTIGMTELEAAKLRNTFDLLNQAKQVGIELTAAQTAELTKLAHQMAEAEHATNSLREAYDFAKDTFKSFFTDIRDELRSGASVWEAFGTAAVNALQKIADKALDMALNGIFDMIFGALGGGFGGGGNILSSLFNWHESGTSFAPGGWSVVGERGPELMKLPAGTQVQANHRVSTPSFGGGGANNEPLRVEVFVNDDGTLGALVRNQSSAVAAQVVETRLDEYRHREMPIDVRDMVSNPRSY